jgi:hypothetical protein
MGQGKGPWHRRTTAPTRAPPPVPETTNGISGSRRRGGTGFGPNHQTGTETDPILLVTDLQWRSLSAQQQSTLSFPPFYVYRKWETYMFASCVKMVAFDSFLKSSLFYNRRMCHTTVLIVQSSSNQRCWLRGAYTRHARTQQQEQEISYNIYKGWDILSWTCMIGWLKIHFSDNGKKKIIWEN